MRLASLRAQLFAAIVVVALLSLALALALGAILTRRAVERNTLRDVSAQFDLLVERERQGEREQGDERDRGEEPRPERAQAHGLTAL